MAATLVQHAETLAGAGRVAEALRLLDGAGRGGDADALFLLAAWRLEGRVVPRDLAQARGLFQQAARAGRGDAAAIFAAFLANGTGGARDWPGAIAVLEGMARYEAAARDQLAIVAAMDIDANGDPRRTPAPARLSASPDLVRLPALMTAAECDFLIGCAEPMMAPAIVVDPRTGGLIRNPIRTSDGASFPLALENPAIHALNRRFAAASRSDVCAGEPLQVLSYRPGEQYRPHLDALDPREGNQRVLTLLVYLTDDYAGGETRFLPDGPTVKGNRGDAIVFRNVAADGRVDPASRHAGLPVTSGRKLIASRWIRERPLDLGEGKRA